MVPTTRVPAASVPATAEGLARAVVATGERTAGLVADLSDAELVVPRLAILNPFLWELGHVAWFHERWALREGAGAPPLFEAGDDWWDSSEVAHDSRWTLAVPSRAETEDYFRRVHARVAEGLLDGPCSERQRYLAILGLLHEDMHGEAFTYMRQTLGMPPPRELERASGPGGDAERGAAARGDVEIPGGRILLGAPETRGRVDPFVFDNEKWAHPVDVATFAIARCAVTQREYRELVEAGGYARRELWSPAGWDWRTRVGAELPAYWRRTPDGGFERRDFDRWRALEDDLPVSHVTWFEADAYCRFAGRRLPTEAEWQHAAGPARYPWGDAPPTAEHANLDGVRGGVVSVDAFPSGDSPRGVRQLMGNVWEWTASDFEPFPGFAPDDYADYSRPWFGTRKVLRGGAWMTRARLVHGAWRNFFEPHRSDPATGFRTCALRGTS